MVPVVCKRSGDTLQNQRDTAVERITSTANQIVSKIDGKQWVGQCFVNSGKTKKLVRIEGKQNNKHETTNDATDAADA